ncbi:MAG TPA: hypothetical protein VNS10_08075 [Gemmatimonadaceae bacterium]|nr:hypothetical protein [Gemmatimonadaceae bacterium]
MFRSILKAAGAPVALLAIVSTSAAAQSDLLISPFIAFNSTGTSTRFAGLALTLGGSGLAIRGSGHLALNGTTPSVVGNGTDRPWAADADAVLTFGGHSFGGSRSFAPFAFAGIGTSGASTQNYESRRSNWSYGAGANVPLAGAVDLFGEARWRMSEFVLPTAPDSPSPTTEFRVGVSFHVGGAR